MSLPPDEVEYQKDHMSDDRSTDIIVSTIIVLAAAYVSTVLRFIARRLVNAKYQWDDWCLLIGVILTTFYTVGALTSKRFLRLPCTFLILIAVHFGMGRHAIFLSNPSAFAKSVIVTQMLISPSALAIKLSLLLLYRRIFPNHKLKTITIGTMVFLVLFTLVQMLSPIYQCSPPAYLWDPASHPDAHCINYTPPLILFLLINAVTDLAILIFPMPILWRLKISTRKKWRLLGIFSLGGLVCIVGFIRCAYVNQVTRVTDPSWDDVTTVILSAVELDAGIICANIPTLLPIWNYMRHGRAQLEYGSGTGGQQLKGRSNYYPSRGQELESGQSWRHLSQSSNRGSIESPSDAFKTEPGLPRQDDSRIQITTNVEVLSNKPGLNVNLP